MSTTDVVVTLHVLAVVVTFGGAFAYPLWFRMIRHATPEERAFFHRAQARLGKVLIMPGVVVIFGTGAYLASDADVWGQAWVLIPTGILAVVVVTGVAVLGPSEERLGRGVADAERGEYDSLFARVKLATLALTVLVVAAVYMMVARTPGGGAGQSHPTSRGAAIARDAGCLTCHRIGSAGRARPGRDLTRAGAQLTRAEIRSALVDPPPGMPSFAKLPPAERQALVGYLAGLR